MNQLSGQVRTVVRDVYPTIDSGRYAIKRVVGETVNVWADVLVDGHDIVCAAVQYRHKSERRWREASATSIGEDRWHASFHVDKLGEYVYRVAGWVDYALYWQYGLSKKADAGVNVSLEIQEGLEVLQTLLGQCTKSEAKWLEKVKGVFKNKESQAEAIQLARSEKMSSLLAKYPNRPFIAYSPEYKITVEREKAVFSTWYEFFPRSSSPTKGTHGTFKDCINLLPRVAELGFDTLYFPPVHPIGYINRKGKNNTTTALDGDVGSCWGIGSKEGGHKDIHPKLGTLADFKRLIKEANKLGIEIAMDYALQATPDHPWVKQHPAWFKQRPDGSIQYAENPPKKYQDIYPVYFETEDWKKMWSEFKDILLFWIEQGLHVFRVDNPHTKPFGFWEWIIAEIRTQHPDIVFLSEAFSRPKVMHELAKAGFSQSYTYFTWRNTKQEIIAYMQELTQGPMSESFRPNFWPNTPDILPYALQNQSEHIYLTRYFLAATLSSNCGVYGPVYELMQNAALPGKEEYKDSEKFEVSYWNWDERNAITQLYTVVNQARKTYKALQRTNNVTFCAIENDQLLAYLKTGTDGSKILCVVNLDGQYPQAGHVQLHPDQLGKSYHDPIQVKDLITGKRYTWHGDSHFVQLYPTNPVHLFVIE